MRVKAHTFAPTDRSRKIQISASTTQSSVEKQIEVYRNYLNIGA